VRLLFGGRVGSSATSSIGGLLGRGTAKMGGIELESRAMASVAETGMSKSAGRARIRSAIALEQHTSKPTVNFLEGTTYSDKVLAQMNSRSSRGSLPDFHGFPLEVDNFAKLGRMESFIGGDGIGRTKILLEGGSKVEIDISSGLWRQINPSTTGFSSPNSKHGYVMNQETKKKILGTATFLDEYGFNDLAWGREDALAMIRSLLEDKIGILGGDACTLTQGALQFSGDNWICQTLENETAEQFYMRSKLLSLAYIENYPVPSTPSEMDLLFSVTFTESVAPSKEQVEHLVCRVCGRSQDSPPWGEDDQSPTYETCDCCGAIFGCDDCSTDDVRAFRTRWLAGAAQWNASTSKPTFWKLEKQMNRIPIKYRT
jgi:hypothetical protein